MIDEEEWLMMKMWYKRGMSISEIARRTGRDRKTVRKHVKGGCSPPKYKEREEKPSILEPFKGYIAKEIDDNDLSAVRLFEDLQKMGYLGKYTIVKDYARSIRKEKAIRAVCRFETDPGRQGQVDWKEVPPQEIDGGARKIYAFTMVLGYSRAKYLENTLDTTTETFIQCHVNAFARFGGYPQEMLYDNTKNVVLTRALKSGDSRWNPLFEDFFTHYGFIPRLCRPYRPQTKGKVENVIKYEDGNFFNGLKATSIQDMNAQAIAWCRKVDSKPHGTTGVPPLERLEEERKHLLLLTGKPPYQVIQKAYRKISRDCYVSYMSNKYSVPWKYAGRDTELRIHDGKLGVFVAGEPVCEHELRAGSGNSVRVKEHFAGLYKETRERNLIIHEKRLQKQLRLHVEPVVEQRPLTVYDEFCGTGGV